MSWLPLESNPQVMNKYLANLGVSNKWQIVDVYGLEPDLLSVIPQPVLSVLLLVPCSQKYEEYKASQEAEISEKGQKVAESLYYLKQVAKTDCGTIALIHSVANNTDKIQLDDGHLKHFIENSLKLSPEERGQLLQKSEGIMAIHRELAGEGQTVAPQPEERPSFHFVTFVLKDGHMYELDGKKAFPVNHGPSSANKLLQDAARVCRDYMARDPDELHFNVVAMSAAP